MTETSKPLTVILLLPNRMVLKRTNISRRLLKTEFLATLEKADLRKVFRFIEDYPPHLLLNPLFIALCNSQEQVRWHAVCGFGRIVPAMADNDPESARIVMRRFLWSLNDESGGIGWGAPEAMAEIMFHSTLLRQEYLHMLVSYMREDGVGTFQDGNYLELPLLQRGLLWGIGRLCQGHRTEMVARQLDDDIAAYLSSPDHHVVGLAIWCLGILGRNFAVTKISGFLGHTGEVRLFFDNSLKTVTVAKLAEYSLKQIRTGEQSVDESGV
ncbi:MAG: HEAT repeat domain-containing protein [Proteobacteria bacterium]|nr:HEAT repeat domain-containing protein [Pseudomonadota bacterium]